MIQREAEVQIDDQFVHCVAFIGIDTLRGFRPEGTCFFLNIYDDEQTFTYAITAGHVIRNLSLDTISIRVQRKSGLAPRPFDTRRNEWIFHKNRNVDICVYPVDWRTSDANGDLDIIALAAPQILLTMETGEHYGFGLGSEIFMPSAFVYATGEKTNLPIVRFGNVAAMPLEPMSGSPRQPPFLIETRSLGGMSGAPVMFHIEPGRRYRRAPLATDPITGLRITPYFLIGMLLGTWRGQNIADFIDMGADIPTDADFNSGISVVLPHGQIMEVINQDELKAARAATIAELRRISGYRPTSG